MGLFSNKNKEEKTVASGRSAERVVVPHAGPSTEQYRPIHVIGSVQEGFNHEIIRDYNLTKTTSKPMTPIEIGVVSTRHLVEVAEDFRYGRDSTARDAFEDLVLSIPAPGKSLNRASDSPAERSGPPRRVTLSDCQWWVVRVVEKLVERGYLVPPTRGLNKGKSPLEIIANAPRH
ncbi:hypothetical protein K449DRAFT_438452 [Hypoxylon sp. EC38]|nr:hypothetical protein K449DRAFT_438452 [Hypoxylon sp. EC38]